MKFRFKSFGGLKSPSEDVSTNPHEKRRDQVRRAQKSHRERKEAYLKSLELEVNRLRKSEESWRSETHKLRAEVKELKDALARNGIPVPLDEQCTPSDGIADVTFEFEITDGAANKGKQPTILARRVPPLDNSSGLPVGASQGMQLYTQPETIYQNADPTGVGISFVLSLEEPCLAHVFPQSEEVPIGHGLTITSALINRDLGSSANATHRHLQNTSWKLPSPEIESLLELSSRMPLKPDEITPVQAWDLIRKLPNMANVRLEQIEALRQKLRVAVVCQGFGGVINVNAFDRAIIEIFGFPSGL